LIRYLIFFWIGAFSGFTAQAAEVFGRVTDESGKPLPFTTLYVKGTTTGTTTNINGHFSLLLEEGSYELVFKFVGFKTQIHSVSLSSEPLELRIRMVPDIIRLDEVVVKAGKEDPAYRVIREAIKKRKFHLREVKTYSCDVYIKGLQRLDEAPEKVLGFNVNLDTGIVYLSESVSKLSFEQPDKFKEKVISSKVSGDNRAFSYNMAYPMMANFYENLLGVEGLTERGFVSPIANNALLFYEYRLDGVIPEGDLLINKIEVVPKRKGDPAFRGYIYIIEDTWRIHSLDLMLTKNQIEFVDSLKVNQIYTQLGDGRWMMFTQNYSFKFGALGFKGRGYFVGVYRNYDLQPAFARKFFNHEIYTMIKEANQRDSIYWAEIRPIPLTSIEKEDYRLKDSIQVIKDSRPYQDSVDKVDNKITFSNILFGGYTYSNSFKKKYYSFGPIISIFQFNTVEGLVTNLKVDYTKRFENRTFYRITPELRYGFSSNDFYGRLSGLYWYNPRKFSYVAVSGGHFVQQYNSEEPIKPFINTLMTLFAERNYMKLYEKSYGRVKFRSELFNGFLFTSSIEYAQRRALENTTDYSFVSNSPGFSSNIPLNASLAETFFNTHQALILDFDFRIRIAQKYLLRPYQKFNLGSKYPTLTLKFRAGLGILGGDSRFNQFELKVEDDWRMGLVGNGAALVTAGTFVDSEDAIFIDYKHFNGNRTPFGNYQLGNFHLLDYYFYSTNEDYLTAHYEHHFNGFIFNKIPLIRKLKLQAVAGINYLYTDASKSYFEVGGGIEHIFKIARIDVYTSFLDGKKADTGVRFGFGF